MQSSGNLGGYLLSRFAIYLASLLGASILIFILMDTLGGDAANVILGREATPESLAALREELGLNQPPLTRYFAWIGDLVTFDLGESIVTKYDIGQEFSRRLALTLPLATISLVVSAVVGLSLGIYAAVQRRSLVGKFVHLLSQIGITIPPFWTGIILSLVVGVYLSLLPTGGYVRPSESLGGAIQSLILPAASLSLVQSAVFARYARAALLDVMGEDYMRMARGLGLGKWHAIFRHGLRNASIPLLTVLGLQFGGLIGGSVIIESVFFLPGLGRLVIEAVNGRETLVVQSSVMVLTTIILTLNLLTDVAYGLIDPRVRVRARS